MRTRPKNPTINGVQVEMDIYFDVYGRYEQTDADINTILYVVYDDETDEVLSFGDEDHLNCGYYSTSNSLTEWGEPEPSEPGYSVVTIRPMKNRKPLREECDKYTSFEVYDTISRVTVADSSLDWLQNADGYLIWWDDSDRLQISSDYGPIEDIKKYLKADKIELAIRVRGGGDMYNDYEAAEVYMESLREQ